MEREEKVEGERKAREFMGGKLKRGILVGKREGNCTPSPTWKFGLVKPDGTLIQDFNFPTYTNTTNLSARKLGANLWEVQPHHKRRMAKMSTKDGHNMIHYEGEKSSGLPKQLAEAQSEIFAEQLTSGINLEKQVASLLAAHNQRVKRVGLAQQPASPSSYCSSMEMAPSRTAFTTNSSLCSKAKTGVSSYGLKTSTELLKVLNRIWSLEERHVLDMSLVKMLRREVEQSRSQITELLQEKKSDKQEIDNLAKQVMGAKVFRKNKEQERMKDVVKLMEGKQEDERKLRKHLESLYQKRSQELLEVEALLSNALKELGHEKKKRALLEDLCDEFAKGVRDYEQEVRFLKQKSSMDQLGREDNDGLILHISEAWLDERMQMKLADPNAEKPSVLDRLSSEIETFLQTKKSSCHEKSDHLSSKKTIKSNILRHSLESIHLNDPASAPWNANDEDDSISIGVHCPQFHRVKSLKQGNGFNRQREDEITSDDHPKEMAKFRTTKKKVLPGKVVKGRAVSSLQTQLEECVEEEEPHPMNDESTKLITGYVDVTNGPRMQRKGDDVQRAWLEGKDRKADSDVDLQQYKTTRNHAFSLEMEGKKLQCEDDHSEGAFDPSTFTPSSPVKKWISEVRMADPHISENIPRMCQTLKPNTLKAKLLEARLESQQSRTRASKALFQVD